MAQKLLNGQPWYDTDGNPLHAHGGCMLKVAGTFYWYGENRTGNRYVSLYSSEDLQNWRFRGDVLTADSPTAAHRVRTDCRLRNDDGTKKNIERPKVLYNPRTRQYVMWMHVENGKDYREAACGIAVSDTPDGTFTYLGSFAPFGCMSRDCTLFAESDGTAYFLSTARDNADLHIYRLADDYLNVDALVNRLWPGEYREAPAVMKRNGRYYLFTSFCTGWAPNQCRYAVADSMDGRWSTLTDIGDATTFRSQPAFLLQTADTCYYVGDRWNAEDYNGSRYVVLPLTFTADGVPQLTYTDFAFTP